MSAVFVLESPRVLRIDVSGGAWIRPGAALAHRGPVRFARRPTVEATSVADAAMRELVPLVRVSGEAQVYCGWRGCHIRLLRLAGERLVVAAEELVAFEDTLGFEPGLVQNGIGVAAGGLLTVTLEGFGIVAIGLHGEPLTLPVEPGAPISTDPLATVGWSATLAPTLELDVSWRTIVGHGGGEPLRMRFEGSGTVLVEPFRSERRWHPEHLLRDALKAFVPAP